MGTLQQAAGNALTVAVQLGASPVAGFFLNHPFGCQKHHFKHKIQDYF